MLCALWEELPGSNVGVRLSQILHSGADKQEESVSTAVSSILFLHLTDLPIRGASEGL